MAAPDYPTLYDFEGQLDTAFAAAITAAGLQTFKQQDTTDKTAPWATVQVTVDAAAGRYHTNAAGAVTGNSAWNFTLTVEVATNRTETTGNANAATYRGKVRYYLERWLATQGASGMNARLTYLVIEYLISTGANRSFVDDTRLDLIQFTYAGVFSIKDTSWPT